jgi:hypothetical protein
VGDLRGTMSRIVESSAKWCDWVGVVGRESCERAIPIDVLARGLFLSFRRHRSEQYRIELHGLAICFSHTVQYWRKLDISSSS